MLASAMPVVGRITPPPPTKYARTLILRACEYVMLWRRELRLQMEL